MTGFDMWFDGTFCPFGTFFVRCPYFETSFTLPPAYEQNEAHFLSAKCCNNAMHLLKGVRGPF